MANNRTNTNRNSYSEEYKMGSNSDSDNDENDSQSKPMNQIQSNDDRMEPIIFNKNRPTMNGQLSQYYTSVQTTIPRSSSNSSSPPSSSSFLPRIDEKSSKSSSVMKPSSYSPDYMKRNSYSSRVPSLSDTCHSSDIDSFLDENLEYISSDSDEQSTTSYDNIDIDMSARSTHSLPSLAMGVARRRLASSDNHLRHSFPSSHSTHMPTTAPPLPQKSTAPRRVTSSPMRLFPPPPPLSERQPRRTSKPSSVLKTSLSFGSTTDFEKQDGLLSTIVHLSKRHSWTRFLVSSIGVQLLVLVLICVLTLWSRSQATQVHNTLLKLKEYESTSLLRLHKLESHSMHVHELVRKRRLASSDEDDGYYKADNYGDDGLPKDDIENDPLKNQYEQLSQMTDDLRKHTDLTSLQSTIQESAIEKIVDTYGEGPVKVIVELGFEDEPTAHKKKKSRHTHHMEKGTYISIVLWPDTPHAAWTWLQQIERKVWDGSRIGLNPTSTLLQFRPTKEDPNKKDDSGHLDFVEDHQEQHHGNKNKHIHGAWTIGLRETTTHVEQGIGESKLEMYINLSDNRAERKHETCVGKIFDGFDALQRLLEGSIEYETGDMGVTVKSVSAMHLTHQELEKIYR